jgi:hypothetical protein
MNNQPKIPDSETRYRHIAKLRNLNKHRDKHILHLYLRRS